MKIFVSIILILFSSKSFSKEVTYYLMNDALSMFEWGMLQMEREVKDYVKQKNNEWMECSNLYWNARMRENEVKKIEEKKDDAVTHEERMLVYEYKNNKLKFEGDMNCIYFSENGRIHNVDVDYDAFNDKIYVVFGINYLFDPGHIKHTSENVMAKEGVAEFLTPEKCIYNRNKIASEIFFNYSAYSDTDVNKRFSPTKKGLDSVDGRIISGLKYFFHKDFNRVGEPENLNSHLHSIVNVGVILGSSFESTKAIFCWESLMSSSPSIKIGERKTVMREVFAGLYDYEVFSLPK